ncbi:PDDEXK nuclease domain-containing protein [Bacteroides heparinolyticus]|uniref:PDDEXK nuclease domain-containing protein n=2 Tax=Prevotella heparinolytica TaxID=28113 RepID=UPI0035A1BB12
MNKRKAKHTEITVLYNLPEHWADETAFSFEHLSELVLQLHDSAYSATVKAINRFATIRNYVIGFYIVEYEQHGNDRAKYGDRLLKRLAESVNKRGINETILKNCRRFYLAYPQIKDYLTAISPTASEKSLEKSPTASDKSSQISPTASDKFITPGVELVSKLSFSHIVELLTVDDSLVRFFYETECVRCCWSVKELRRQISTNLYFRAGVSEKPELLLERTEVNTSPVLTIRDPFSFEFLGLRPEAFTESDLENALITHLQEFLLEMGKGFCFEARQKRMIIDDEYYFADLVFYNRILHCNVIIELKDDEFRHADLSQLNAYVSYFRKNEMNPGDNPPVGILLCTRKGDKMVEYALAGMDNNLFVSTYMLSLPDKKTLQDFLLREISK